jgi:hypothetical protein
MTLNQRLQGFAARLAVDVKHNHTTLCARPDADVGSGEGRPP